MIHLTIYKGNTGKRKTTQEMTFKSILEAIHAGQSSGQFYEILDPSTGRIIDWNEVNVEINDGWYYDETELIWKKCPVESSNESWMKKGLDWLFDTKNEEQGSLVY